MGKIVKFTVPGKPVSKGRPRFTRTGHTYTPKQTVEYEKLVAYSYRKAAHGIKFHGAVSLTAVIYMPIPKSYSKKLKQKLEGKPYCKKTGDIDNVIKSLADGCQGIAYDDDAQIYRVNAVQIYSVDPRVEAIFSE